MYGILESQKKRRGEINMNFKADSLLDILREVNSWDDSMEHLNFYENEDSNLEMFFGNDIGVLAREITYGDYHYTDDFFLLNGYGNLESYTDYETEEEILANEEDILERALEISEQSGHMSYLTEEVEEHNREYN